MNVATSQEFRGFVHNGRLCGLCQYFSSVYYPHVAQQKAQIAALVHGLFDQIKDKVERGFLGETVIMKRLKGESFAGDDCNI